MAIVRSLGLGKASGSAGEFTYSTQNGRCIARQRVLTVKNPNTPAQQAQRSKMATVVGLYRQFAGASNKCFTVRKKYSSEYNQFVSMNINKVEDVDYDHITGIYSNLSGICIGSGSVNNGSIVVNNVSGMGIFFNVKDAALLSSLQVGDTVGTFYVDVPSNRIVELSKVLTADDFEDLAEETGLKISEESMDYSLDAPFVLMKGGKISNSPVIGMSV